jgi:hypothetical protein
MKGNYFLRFIGKPKWLFGLPPVKEVKPKEKVVKERLIWDVRKNGTYVHRKHGLIGVGRVRGEKSINN